MALAEALPAPNAVSPSGIQTASGDQQGEVVLDLRTDLEVKLEGPEPITRARGVRIELVVALAMDAAVTQRPRGRLAGLLRPDVTISRGTPSVRQIIV